MLLLEGAMDGWLVKEPIDTAFVAFTTLAVGLLQFGIGDDLELPWLEAQQDMLLTLDTHENPDRCMNPCSFHVGRETDVAEQTQAAEKPTVNRLTKSTNK